MSQFSDTKDFLYDIQKKKNIASLKGKSPTLVGSILDQRKNILDLKILVILDISGSISVQQFSQFMSQIDAIRGLSVVKVLETDDRVTSLYDYFKTEQSQVVRLTGGGGTEFSEAFRLAKKIAPDGLLVLTDGAIQDAPIGPPDFPVGYVLTNDGVQPPFNFGKVVLRLPPI